MLRELSSTPGFISSDLPKGKNFIKKLLYVQHVNKEKDTVSETSERYLEEYLLANRTNFYDSNFTEYLASPNENLSMLKSSMGDLIRNVTVYSNPLPIPLKVPGVTFHAFVVFKTARFRWFRNSEETWWSLEKNGQYIILQQSTNEDDVIKKIYDTETKTTVERLGPIKKQKSDWAFEHVSELMRIIVNTNRIIRLYEPYHLLYSNCQNFASFVFKELCYGLEKWSTVTRAIVDQIGLKKKKIEPKIEYRIADKYKWILNDENFDCYTAMMEGTSKDFEKLIKNLSIKTINSVDSQGYTLLEWATVYSTSDWPIDEELKKKGAQIPSNEEGLFRRNVFFISLQYLPSHTKSKLLSFDGIDINSVNQTGDTSLHLALNGKKWKIVEEILNQFKDFDVNRTNSLGETPLHLVAKLKWDFDLFKNVFLRILERTNQENINKVDENGNTALLYAIDNQCENKVKELLKRDDVDVNIKNYFNNSTALLLASNWENIPADLFKIILDKSTDINAQDDDGSTALHFAILFKSEIATKALLAHNDVDVNAKNDHNRTPLHYASSWEDIPMDLFKQILENSTDVNAQDDDGSTALHVALFHKSEIATKELLAHNDVNVNVQDKNNQTALQFAMWDNIPEDLFNLILEKSTDVNAQDGIGNTALHFAISCKREIATKELLAHSDVDVKVKNNNNRTLLHYASSWEDIPMDLFTQILEKSTDINAQDKDGWTALHVTIYHKSEITTKILLAHKDVNVNIKNNDNHTALSYASKWEDIPMDLFNLISERKANKVKKF